LKRLDELGFGEDAVVIFTCDHGDYMGDHGLMLKLLLHHQGGHTLAKAQTVAAR